MSGISVHKMNLKRKMNEKCVIIVQIRAISNIHTFIVYDYNLQKQNAKMSVKIERTNEQRC